MKNIKLLITRSNEELEQKKLKFVITHPKFDCIMKNTKLLITQLNEELEQKQLKSVITQISIKNSICI